MRSGRSWQMKSGSATCDLDCDEVEDEEKELDGRAPIKSTNTHLAGGE